MKPLLAFLVLAIAVALLANDGTVPSQAGTSPRYQLATGYSHSPLTGDESRETFRLDTYTGETWQLVTMPFVDADGKPRGGFDMWQRIRESGSDLHQQALQLMEKNVQGK